MPILIIILFFIVTGCSITVPTIAEYRLTQKISNTTYDAKECKRKSLKVMQSFSPNNLMSKEMAYVQKGYQEFAFTESEWAQSPNRAINSKLVESLRASQVFANVSSYKSRSKNNLVLESNIEEFIQYFQKKNQKSFVRIVLYLSLIDSKSSEILSSTRITKELDVKHMNAQSGVDSLNKALNKALEDTNKWLNGVCK